MNKQERDEKIELCGHGFDLLKSALTEVPQEAMKFKPEPKEWSVHEIIIHLADSESNSALRARKLIVEPGGILMGYDQAQWADTLKYHDHNLEDALEVTRLARKTTYELLKRQPEEVFTHAIVHPEYEALYTFDQWGQYLFGAYSAYAKGLDLDECSFDQCNVLSDITGVTGMKIIRAIVSGERNRKVLASYRDAKCAKSEEEIEKSLEGNYKLEHLFVLKQALELYDFYDQQIKQCDQELETLYNEFEEPDQPGTPAPEKRKRKRRKNQPHFDLSESLYRMTGGINLTKFEGLDTLTVQEVLSETGTDMRKWRTVKHFCSWLCLAPNNKITGGKVKSSHTPHTKNRASNAFRIAAQSLMKSKSALGAYCRRMAALHDAPTAITATAHKLAKIFYFMLKRREAYRPLAADYYEKEHRDKVVRSLQRRAASLGFRLETVTS